MIFPEIHILILAAGDGKRTNSSIPKQFVEVSGLPLLMHTFNAFSFLDHVSFHLVLSETYIPLWNELISKYKFNIPHQVYEGGPTRYHSVKSGVKHIPESSIVLVHDGVRPMPSSETIKRVIETTHRKGNAVPVLPVSESVREVSGPFNKPLDRNKLYLVQTPQGFVSDHLKEAYNLPYKTGFTDDAMVLEATGHKINTVVGNPENIKVTYQKDLKLYEFLLGNN